MLRTKILKYFVCIKSSKKYVAMIKILSDASSIFQHLNKHKIHQGQWNTSFYLPKLGLTKKMSGFISPPFSWGKMCVRHHISLMLLAGWASIMRYFPLFPG